MRARDLAGSAGISEAELLETNGAPEVVRLRGDMRGLIQALPALGEVMALTRNEAAVHEKVGAFGNISLGSVHGLVLNGAIDLRLFMAHWHCAFAVVLPGEAGPRRSLQIFDSHGDAVLKVHLKPASDVAAFERLVEAFTDPAPERLSVTPAPAAEISAGPADAEAFRRDFDGMKDVHEFFPLLRRHAVTRRAALDHLDGQYVQRLDNAAVPALLDGAAASGLPIMCFVGNRGCIQIHSGPVANIKPMGPWLNVLDPGFNLHLRHDLVAEVWSVRKPTKDGHITSVELYGADQGLIAQFFGVRHEGQPENPAWRHLVASLPVAERESVGS
ncbi:hemin-degrading factor [Propylenella binzhouense]|uniref:Hemin-degrading factor n=1 Tax=Propylenella binzhouense TaxID=2555902 RepID=A0A964T6G4_9HYPH|nr:ChuX/HutX family heme-like substrate-binding protein [Propylenella binzhouense]MYZ49426.1 hemin-degrading factor [Propylenella binzhouense]